MKINNNLTGKRERQIKYCKENVGEFVREFRKRYDLINSQREYLEDLPTKEQRLSHIKQILKEN